MISLISTAISRKRLLRGVTASMPDSMCIEAAVTHANAFASTKHITIYNTKAKKGAPEDHQHMNDALMNDALR